MSRLDIQILAGEKSSSSEVAIALNWSDFLRYFLAEIHVECGV
ncbi:MAG: hypothetical protein AB4426_34790 [Xenococcaceae cyanobacterium]